MKGNVISPYPWWSQMFFLIFFIFSFFLGMGIGFVIGFSLLGLIGGLVGLFLFKRNIIRFPNYKIAAFVGYIAFVIIFYIIPLLGIAGASSEPFLLLIIFGIPFIQAAVTLGFMILFERRQVLRSFYWTFVLSYFCAAFLIAPFMFFVGLMSIFGATFSPMTAITGLLIK